MTRALSDLVTRGAENMTFVWGADGTSEPAEGLADGARSLFPDQADIDRVGILMTNDRPTVEVVVGAILAGAGIVSLPPPGRGVDVDAYAAFVREVCQVQGLVEVVVADQYADLLETTGVKVRRHSELVDRPLAAPSTQGFALVQFTSGSTGQPRPVLIDDQRLGANVGAILDAVRPRPGDAVVSWLPLAHDMGLVGMLLTGLAGGGPDWAGGGEIVLLDPTTFLRDPSRWLAAISRWRGTFTAAPDFGYRLALRRRPVGEVDLSCLRCVIVGGEIVRADTLRSFAAAYSDDGMSDRALCPAYGMAEVGLAVTMTRPDQKWRTQVVSRSALADGDVQAAHREDDATTLVSSGQPLLGHHVDVRPAGAGVGTIHVQAPSLGAAGASGQSLADQSGWYRTGDMGFSDDEWLYVCGRTDDYIVAHGRNIYAPAIEAVVGDVHGVRLGRVVTVCLPTGEWTIVAEPEANEPLAAGGSLALEREVRRAAVSVGSAKPDAVVFVKRGSLPLTSSGKLQRSQIRIALSQGSLQTL
jgi:fatty-acyl-CoA synthase